MYTFASMEYNKVTSKCFIVATKKVILIYGNHVNNTNSVTTEKVFLNREICAKE